MVDSEIQRSLGRIEGAQEQILQRFDRFDQAFHAHSEEDTRVFDELRELVTHHKEQVDKRIDTLELAQQRAQVEDEHNQRVGKYIIGFIGALLSVVGSAVVAVLSHHIPWSK